MEIERGVPAQIPRTLIAADEVARAARRLPALEPERPQDTVPCVALEVEQGPHGAEVLLQDWLRTGALAAWCLLEKSLERQAERAVLAGRPVRPTARALLHAVLQPGDGCGRRLASAELFARDERVVHDVHGKQLENAVLLNGAEAVFALGHAKPRGREKLQVIGWDMYSELAQEVLGQGHTFVVSAAGKPSTATLQPITVKPGDMDYERIRDEARRIGCTDHEAFWILEFGARSHSTPPLCSVYSPNHKGASENAAELCALLEKEKERGWVEQALQPPCIPLGLRPISAVPKTMEQEGLIIIRGYRLITDGSWPKLKNPGAKVRQPDGSQQPLAPNFNYVPGSQPGVTYPAIYEPVQAATPLIELAKSAGVRLVGKCYDFEKWFRQIPMRLLDRLQIVQAWMGSYWHDLRVFMGCVHASNTAQRIAYIVLDVVEARLEAGLEAQLDSLDAANADAIRAWLTTRKRLFPSDPAPAPRLTRAAHSSRTRAAASIATSSASQRAARYGPTPACASPLTPPPPGAGDCTWATGTPPGPGSPPPSEPSRGAAPRRGASGWASRPSS